MEESISGTSVSSRKEGAAAASSTTTNLKKTHLDANLAPEQESSPKRLFAECALVEIIHLHDCLRGALHQIQDEVNSLVHIASVIDENDESCSAGYTTTTSTAQNGKKPFEIEKATQISNLVASRFHLIWSVFQAHSAAEDEFIWPALKMKVESKKACASPNTSVASSPNNTPRSTPSSPSKKCGCESFLEQESYEEDHATEESMFKNINKTLRHLKGSIRYYHAKPDPTALSTIHKYSALSIIKKVILLLKEQTDGLMQHLVVHLKKEETQCLPMVKKHLSNEEISTLVGQIMSKRSAEMMGKILNLAVCSLPGDEREDMVKCLKKAMGGTFFEKWLAMGGWDSRSAVGDNSNDAGGIMKSERKRTMSTGSEMDGSLKRKGSTDDLNNPSK